LPSLATTVAALVFAWFLGIGIGDPRFAMIAVTVLMTQLSISALNDWADRERDAAAGRFRPIAMGRIPPTVALGVAIVCGLGALPGALGFGPTAGLVLAVGLAAGWAYDLWLKPTPLSFLPFAIAFPLLPTWVGLLAGRSLAAFSGLIVGGAFLAIAVHLADSLPDLAYDAAAGVRSLAVELGFERSIRGIVVTLLLGAFVFIASLESVPLIAVLVGVAALLTVSATIRSARHRPQQARWVVGAFALTAALALAARLPHV
jgi:4-hydroxybenzoate polyprenyltransferase